MFIGVCRLVLLQQLLGDLSQHPRIAGAAEVTPLLLRYVFHLVVGLGTRKALHCSKTIVVMYCVYVCVFVCTCVCVLYVCVLRVCVCGYVCAGVGAMLQ